MHVTLLGDLSSNYLLLILTLQELLKHGYCETTGIGRVLCTEYGWGV